MANKRRKSMKPQRLGAKEVESLRREYTAVPDVNLTNIGSGDAYLLSDGRVLFVFEDGKGILYPSREQVTLLLNSVEKMANEPPEHPVQKLLPQGRDFIGQVQALVEELASVLNMPPSLLDKSEESLDLLEQGIGKFGSRAFLNRERLPMLVAYVGEVIREKQGGQWQMFEEPNTARWEPIIVDLQGRVYQPFALVYQELQRGRRGSIRGATNGVLRSHLLSGRPEDGTE